MFNKFLALLVVTVVCIGLSAELRVEPPKQESGKQENGAAGEIAGEVEETSFLHRKLPSLFTILIDLFRKDKDERIIGTYSVAPGNHYTSQKGILPWGVTSKKQIRTKVILSDSCATYNMVDTATYKCGVSYWRKFCSCVVGPCLCVLL